MTFVGLAVIVTGTAMCVAGWYLGHFDDDDQLQPQPVAGATTNSSHVDQVGVVISSSSHVDEDAPEVGGATSKSSHIEKEASELGRTTPRPAYRDAGALEVSKRITSSSHIEGYTPAVGVATPDSSHVDEVVGLMVEMRPARGLAYAGPG